MGAVMGPVHGQGHDRDMLSNEDFFNVCQSTCDELHAGGTASKRHVSLALKPHLCSPVLAVQMVKHALSVHG
jgi:hypothetical protein